MGCHKIIHEQDHCINKTTVGRNAPIKLHSEIDSFSMEIPLYSFTVKVLSHWLKMHFHCKMKKQFSSDLECKT